MFSKILANFRRSILGRSLKVLDKSDRKKIFFVALFQVFLGFLDLIGIAAIGILGALAVNGISSNPPGDRVTSALQLFQLGEWSFQSQVAVIGLFAAIALVSRTLLSIFFIRKTLFFLSRRSAKISSNLISAVLSQNILKIQKKSTQETLFAVTEGVSALTLGVLSTSIILLSDVALLFVMIIGLFLVDIAMAVGTCLLFGVISLSLYKLLQVRARDLGIQSSKLIISGNEKILEVLNSYRELIVKNRRSYYASEIGKIRYEYSSTQAEMFFLPNISKYVIEIAVITGALLISAVQFITQDAVHAVATLSVFMAAGTRIAPAVMRIQQGSLQLRSSRGSAELTLELIDHLDLHFIPSESPNYIAFDHHGFKPEIMIENISFTYPGQNLPAVKNVSINFKPGEVVAIVGPSGAGKTTLIDLFLGVLEPDSGKIEISGLTPGLCVRKWPGAISYIPQDVAIVSGTIRSNVSLGYPIDIAKDLEVWKALELAKLQDVVESMPGMLDANVGERGAKISGGQRQRLGIARALFTNPKMLVLDEATSALDGRTESEITSSLHSLKGEVTILLIAHRLSSVREADTVIYMDKGHILAQGTFEEVRSKVKDFDIQAKLMGI